MMVWCTWEGNTQPTAAMWCAATEMSSATLCSSSLYKHHHVHPALGALLLPLLLLLATWENGVWVGGERGLLHHGPML
jgi:hypothetical protein